VKSWLEAGAGFFYPNVCQVCQCERATADEGYVCPACWRGVQFIQPPFCDRCGLPFEGEITTAFECANCHEMELHFQRARAAVVSKGVVRDVIHCYKYQRALWFEPFLADLLTRHAVPALAGGGWDMIIPVPLHPAKFREREFNQAERLGAALSRATGIPMNAGALRRVQYTETQTELPRPARLANVRHAFEVVDMQTVKGTRCVVVDDVMTTGATTSACAKALNAAGAAKVCVWTVARAIL
jgi:competence protein ComFC